MTTYPAIILNHGKEHSLLRYHPWVFSGAIHKIEGAVEEGDVVAVYTSKGEFMGQGHYQTGSLAVRIFSFAEVEVDYAFWLSRVQRAYDYRREQGFVDNPTTDVYRLIFAEGDSMPGLIVDVYGNTAVLQAQNMGMYQVREQLAQALVEVYEGKLTAVYNKSTETLPGKGTQHGLNGYLIGNTPVPHLVIENGNQFLVDWVTGQKTGFFIDQRENRQLLARYAQGKTVLNTFCYTGGFSVYALNAGATMVHSVDVSKKAIALTEQNADLNNGKDRHHAYALDVFNYLDDKEDVYDVIILDPPAFAKSQQVRHNALMGYKRLNADAIEKIKPGGIIFTFSCSGVVDKALFQNTVMAAAIEAGRNVKVMHHLSQPADHPISIFHPEGEYLKGLVLYVE